MTNKKIRVFFRAVLLMLLTLNISGIQTAFSEEKNVDMAKVKRYIKEVGEIFRNSSDPFNWDSTQDQKYLDLVKEINLNDDEVIELMKIIRKEIDMKIYEKYPYIEEEVFNKDDYAKYATYSFAAVNLLEKWKKIAPESNVIMNKIIPLIKKSDDDLKPTWIAFINEFKIPDEIQPQVMDELMKMFSDKNNSEDVRLAAAYVWTSKEQRVEKKYEGFDILLKDEDVFEKVGTYLWFLNKAVSPAPRIYDKLFNVLKNRDKYSIKILNGILDCFQRDSYNFWADKDGKIRERLKKALEEIIEKGKNMPYIEKSRDMLQYIEKKEKEGVYK